VGVLFLFKIGAEKPKKKGLVGSRLPREGRARKEGGYSSVKPGREITAWSADKRRARPGEHEPSGGNDVKKKLVHHHHRGRGKGSRKRESSLHHSQRKLWSE